MPYTLDDIDVAIIKSLAADGRKSFRQISRELDISTPTIKIRFSRLVSIGLIKSVSPILDTSKIEERSKKEIEKCHCEVQSPNVKLEKNMTISMTCDLCGGLVPSKPHILKFAEIERFFCCKTCKAAYKEKYKGRIKSLIQNS